MLIYGNRSNAALDSAHPLWRAILTYVLTVLEVDHAVLEGHRDKATQDACFNAVPPTTTLRWPFSKHNQFPSLAVDVVPYPIRWNDASPRVVEKYKQEMVRFATIVQLVARFVFDVTVRWGGDWDRDWSTMDNVFNDYPHLELVL